MFPRILHKEVVCDSKRMSWWVGRVGSVTLNRSPLFSLVVLVGHCQGLSQIALDSWGRLYLVVSEEELPKIELVPKLCCASSQLGAADKMGWGNLSQNKQAHGAKAGGRGWGGSKSHLNDVGWPPWSFAFSLHFSSSCIYNMRDPFPFSFLFLFLCIFNSWPLSPFCDW